MRKGKRLLGLLLSLLMVLAMLPTTVFAVEEIHSANITITKPVGGENPDFNPVSDEPDKYFIEDAHSFSWSKMEGMSYPVLGAGDTFETHARYVLRVLFVAKAGYTFADDCVFTINGETTGCWSLDANQFRYTYLYAADPQRPDGYTVTFDANGGGGIMAPATNVFDTYTLPSCGFTAPNGKYFNGWSVGGYLKDPSETINGVLSDKTVTASWADVPAQGYTVTFDANGGTGEMQGKSNFYGEYTLPDCSFTPPIGQQFSSWGVSGGNYGALNPGRKIIVDRNIEIYASWEPIPVQNNTISYADVSVTPPAAGAVSSGGTIKETEKYRVSIGWSTTSDGSSLNDFNYKTFEAGKTYYADIYVVAEDPYTFASGATIYVNDEGYPAVWAVGAEYTKYIAVYDVPFTVPSAPTTYTVSFAANGGTGSMSDRTGLSGDFQLPMCEFSPPGGKQFKAWAKGSVNGTQYNAGYGCTIDSNVTFYAIWEDAQSAPTLTGVTRVFGATRYETSFKSADELKAVLGVEKFDNVIVASGTGFADALAGSYLAAKKDAPILLVKSGGEKTVREYIKSNLKSGGTVYILGGTAAVPAAMESGLDGFTVKRLGGNTRYETNLLILKEAGVTNEDIIVCTGNGFADSLSASATGLPILLVKDSLNAQQKEFLSGVTGEIVIVGGTAAVKATVETALKAYGSVDRLAGNTRYETSVLVAKKFFSAPAGAVLAYAQNFPDGLCGGPLAYNLNAPLILTDSKKPTAAVNYATQQGISGGYVLGGTGLISDSVVRSIFGLAGNAEIGVR